jgi:hypothetical protein
MACCGCNEVLIHAFIHMNSLSLSLYVSLDWVYYSHSGCIDRECMHANFSLEFVEMSHHEEKKQIVRVENTNARRRLCAPQLFCVFV